MMLWLQGPIPPNAPNQFVGLVLLIAIIAVPFYFMMNECIWMWRGSRLHIHRHSKVVRESCGYSLRQCRCGHRDWRKL